MDAALFTKMLSDKSVLDLKKLGYKYPQADMGEFVSLLKNGFYHPLPLKDFSGQSLVYLDSVAQVHLSAARILLTPQSSTQLYGAKAMEEEIISTFTIEQVDFSRDSVRKILSGFAPADDPQIVILVLLDTPSSSTGIYISGGQMAAPTVGKMMADILPYLGVEPSYSETEKTYMDKTVPNVTGLSVEQAKAALEEVGLQARVYGEGDTVTAQLPGSGAVVASGSTILLYAGKEPSADKETMPDLTNLSYQTARDRMAALGLYIKLSLIHI